MNYYTDMGHLVHEVSNTEIINMSKSGMDEIIMSKITPLMTRDYIKQGVEIVDGIGIRVCNKTFNWKTLTLRTGDIRWIVTFN